MFSIVTLHQSIGLLLDSGFNKYMSIDFSVKSWYPQGVLHMCYSDDKSAQSKEAVS